ncbi:hypothetical protein [Marinilabilia rubra]|uniref:Uncharacterized protein n=1 Tax=Marinilabilia rubra TaxID=2162893 RepID=A0A2U2BD60_9BACT|nr:hypothetical protein [Marinilabilia rubra]PWE00999.1 hypothetical protein DDZ16_00485 [Marinilabilia rubra]
MKSKDKQITELREKINALKAIINQKDQIIQEQESLTSDLKQYNDKLWSMLTGTPSPNKETPLKVVHSKH